MPSVTRRTECNRLVRMREQTLGDRDREKERRREKRVDCTVPVHRRTGLPAQKLPQAALLPLL